MLNTKENTTMCFLVTVFLWINALSGNSGGNTK